MLKTKIVFTESELKETKGALIHAYNKLVNGTPEENKAAKLIGKLMTKLVHESEEVK